MSLLEFAKDNEEEINSLLIKDNVSFDAVSSVLLQIALISNHFDKKADNKMYIKEEVSRIDFIIKSYLAIYVAYYGFEKTLEFIQSRSMWENKISAIRTNKSDLLINMSILLKHIEKKGSFSKLPSEFTLKPLFYTAQILTLIKTKL